jgi:uncharacterized Fe-S cluster-containing radical SAM superfamily protein
MSPNARKKTKKNVMAWFEPEEIERLKQVAKQMGVNKTRLIKMALKLAEAHLEDLEEIKRKEDEGN